MKTAELLANIRSPWLFTVSHRLAQGEELRENFEQLLVSFFESLQQAVESSDFGALDLVLDGWVQARTESELERREAGLLPVIGQILLLTLEISREKLTGQDALALISDIMPAFLHATEYVVRRETALYVEHMSRELEKANVTLKRLDRSKSDFISIAAHELKTPLTLIEGYTAMMRDQLPKQEQFEQSQVLLKGMDNGTRRLREIVDDMIDVSLIDNSLLSLHFQPVWPNRLLRTLQIEFRNVITQRRQVLEVCAFPGSNEMTFGDEERLSQAFRNLFSNAIKYTPDGGRIVVDGRKLPGFVEITIADNGIGIDAEDHTRIFEKFGGLGSVSLHSSGKTKFKGGGPGLGLPITKGIIEAHGGAIWVESAGYDETKCPGSMFHVLLPSRKSPPDDKMAKLFHPLSESQAEDSLPARDAAASSRAGST
jgi:signal transduction histidine kinase